MKYFNFISASLLILHLLGCTYKNRVVNNIYSIGCNTRDRKASCYYFDDKKRVYLFDNLEGTTNFGRYKVINDKIIVIVGDSNHKMKNFLEKKHPVDTLILLDDTQFSRIQSMRSRQIYFMSSNDTTCAFFVFNGFRSKLPKGLKRYAKIPKFQEPE